MIPKVKPTTEMPRCVGCGERPENIMEYREASSAENYGRKITPSEYVRREEGTYNRVTGGFYCTNCYCRGGMPSGTA